MLPPVAEMVNVDYSGDRPIFMKMRCVQRLLLSPISLIQWRGYGAYCLINARCRKIHFAFSPLLKVAASTEGICARGRSEYMKVAQVLYQELDIGAAAITDREIAGLGRNL